MELTEQAPFQVQSPTVITTGLCPIRKGEGKEGEKKKRKKERKKKEPHPHNLEVINISLAYALMH